MNIHEKGTKYPYVTFSFNRYATRQTDFADLLLPELSSDLNPNIQSINNIDTCLTHLESSPILFETKTNYQEIRIPSENLLRILLTLAISKSMQSNEVRIHGLNNFDDYSRSDYAMYESLIEKTSLKNRSIELLRNYIQYINSNLHEPLAILLYNRFKSVFGDLISLKESGLLNIGLASKTQQSSIDASFSISPTKNQSVVDQNSQSTDIDETGEISDSEDEQPLKSFEDRDAEIQKYKLSRPNLNLPIEPSPIIKSPSRSRATTPQPAWKWYDILVFGDELITKRLNSRYSRYNIWLLINWTFFCSEKSCEFMIDTNSDTSNSHHLYETYRDLLNLIFDFLIINFLNADKSPIIEKLLSHLSVSNKYWYDRLVEFTLNGLERHRYVTEPKLCYVRDNNSVSLDFQNYKQSKSVNQLYSNYSDIFDSMSLRFKILILIYNWSFYQKPSFLSSNILTSQIATKFNNLHWKLFQEFYNCGEFEYGNLLEMYNYQFLLNFSDKSIQDIIKSVEIEISIPSTVDEINYKKCQQILIDISNIEVYEEIIDDNDDDEKLYQKWMRLNIIFQWLLIVMLTKQDKDYTPTELHEIYNYCQQGDLNRQLFFENHLNKHDQEWTKFKDIFENVYHEFMNKGLTYKSFGFAIPGLLKIQANSAVVSNGGSISSSLSDLQQSQFLQYEVKDDVKDYVPIAEEDYDDDEIEIKEDFYLP